MRPSMVLGAVACCVFALLADDVTGDVVVVWVVAVSDPGGSSDEEDGATGAVKAGSPA